MTEETPKEPFFFRIIKQRCPKHGLYHYRLDIKEELIKEFETFLNYVEHYNISKQAKIVDCPEDYFICKSITNKEQ